MRFLLNRAKPVLTIRSGFSLLELSVVLAIIGVVLAGGLTVGLGAMEASRVNETVSRMDAIHKALLNYSTSFYRLPCPSSLTLGESDVNYGIEGATKGTCTGGTPAANNTAASGTVEGGVPTRTLQLSDEYMYDGWGRRIRYSVNPDYTADASLPVGTGSCTSSKSVTMNDAAAASRTTNGVYALISHGANGHGGYTRNGVMFNAASTNTDEQNNCHCDASAVATTYSATYVQKLPTESSSTATDKFDDIVSYRDAWQLQTVASPLSSTACTYYIWVADNANNRVQKFNASGTYITSAGAGYNGSIGTIGDCGYGSGRLCGPLGLATDSSWNIYVQQGAGLYKFNKNGVWQQDILYWYWGSANGEEAGLAAIARDSSGNFWMNDAANYRLQQADSSGAWVRSRGGPAPHTCETSPAGSIPSCAFGSGNGQYGQLASGLHIDASSNIWVGDHSNYRVVKLDSTGNYVSQFPCASGACSSSCSNGYFGNKIWGIATDSSGNLWVSDAACNRVQKFNSSGVYQSQIPCASGSCSSGTANGQFANGNGADLVAIAPDGTLWVGDYTNNRVQHFDTSGNYLGQLGCGGTGSCGASLANGYLEGPEGIVITTE